jgi:hypothetical protein
VALPPHLTMMKSSPRVKKIFQGGREGGYLYEIPLLVLLVAIVALVLGSWFPKPWNIILLLALALVVILFLVYNFFFAGWRPKRK